MTDETLKQTLTELDETLLEARGNRASANLFYDTFLNTEVFIPAVSANKKPGEWKRLEKSERFFPLYLRYEENRAIPVFDGLEKLKTWAGDRTFDYLVLPAHLLLKVIAEEIFIVLNENSEYRYLFTPEILERLRNAMKPVRPQ